MKIDAIKITPPKSIKGIIVATPYWIMIVDIFTGVNVIKFYATKTAMVESTWKDKDKSVKRVRCDNTGKHVRLEERSKSAD